MIRRLRPFPYLRAPIPNYIVCKVAVGGRLLAVGGLPQLQLRQQQQRQRKRERLYVMRRHRNHIVIAISVCQRPHVICGVTGDLG